MAVEEDIQSKTVIVAPGMAHRLTSAPRARLCCSDPAVLAGGDGEEILLDGAEVTVGRGNENRVKLSADGISRRHARIYPYDQTWYVEDAGSTNGVRVNGDKVDKIALQDGDVVEIGVVPYAFSVDPEPEEQAVDRPTLEFAGGIPGLRPERHAIGGTSGSVGSNALLWSIVLIGAGALLFAIYTVVSV